MNIYTGTSGYSYKEWKGAFYPADLPAKRMLRFYGEHFRAVEINNTFYRMPKAAVVEAWAAEVPPNFQFALKAPQQITHRQRLKGPADSVKELLDTARALKKRLGPMLFQLPPFFKKDASALRDFLALLPSGCRAAFEFRHQSWLEQEVFDLLHEHRAALCIADAENDLEIPFIATAEWGYLRLRRTEYTGRELKAWAGRAREQPWKEAFVFFKHDDVGRGPAMAGQFAALAGSYAG
jgi:uncharacterized protein YecE (DUF72 family)